MRSYNYVAINTRGRRIRGTVTAENELDLEERLKQAGMDMVSAKPARERRSTFFSRVRPQDLIVLCLHLEQLDRAGVPLHEALADIRDTTESARLKDVLTGVYESVKSGTVLSKALAQHPKVFNTVFVGLIAAGEKTGNLADSFMHLADHLKWMNDIRRKIQKAIRYPAVLLVVIAGVITTLMTFVVPQLIEFILAQGFTVPLHTRALIATSNAFVDYWYLIFGIPIILTMLLSYFYIQYYAFAYKVDALLLKAPVFGKVIRKIDMARFTHFFSVMFNSGIDILDSLDAGGGVVRNRVLRESVEFVRTSVMDGNSMTLSLKLSNQFPSLVIRMFKVGEDSGNMKNALENITFFYDREVNDAVEGMVSMIQPALTVVLGALIFWIIAAVFGPLYENLAKMKY